MTTTEMVDVGRKLAEQVEDEAARAEAEPDEDEGDHGDDLDAPTPDDDPDLAASTPAVLSDREIEKAGKALDAESERHGKRVAQILGDDFADWVPCPLCPIPGFVVPSSPPPAEPERKAAILALIGEGFGPDLKMDATTETCAACDGWGDVLTGARADRSKTKSCNTCAGTGYTTRMPPPLAVPGYAPAPTLDGSFAPPMIPGVPPPPTPTWDAMTGTWKLP